MSDDGFLSRWSKRKRAAKTPEERDAETADTGAAEEAVPPATEDEAELTDAEIIEKYGLKDPDELEQGDDFAGFMRSAVPEHLRRRALRRLWRSNPILANLDGLNDYDGDMTGGVVPAGELKTVYRVGAGMVRKAMEVADKVEAASDGGDDPIPDPVVPPADPLPDSSIDPEVGDLAEAEDHENLEIVRTPVRRRMKFSRSDT